MVALQHKPAHDIATLETCELLAWDTAFWGIPVARIRATRLTPASIVEIDRWSCQQGIRCLYFLTSATDLTTSILATEHGFQEVDVRLTLTLTLPAGLYQPTVRQEGACPKIRTARPDDVPALRAITRGCYHDTRFYQDWHFSREKCQELYEIWIARSCAGYADQVFVADLDGAPAGYISCHLHAEHAAGTIGLVGVGERARKCGLGRALLAKALAWFTAQGVRTVQVVTQGRNLAAQQLYCRAGFQLSSEEQWYHRWYEPSEAWSK